jgi:hypothetical protein
MVRRNLEVENRKLITFILRCAPTALNQAQDTISVRPLSSRIIWIQSEPLAFLSGNPTAPRYDVAVLAHSLWYLASLALILTTLYALATRARRICIAE